MALVIQPGWDGPGLGDANVSYYFGALTGDGPSEAAIKASFVDGFDAWSAGRWTGCGLFWWSSASGLKIRT